MKARTAKIQVSFAIITILALQTATTFRIFCLPEPLPSHPFLRQFCSPRLWPFLTYPMYKRPYYEGDKVVEYFIYGILEDSSEVAINPENLDVNYWMFLWDFVPALQHDDQEKIQEYVAAYHQKYNRKLIGLRLESHPWIISPEGVKPGEPRVLSEWSSR